MAPALVVVAPGGSVLARARACATNQLRKYCTPNEVLDVDAVVRGRRRGRAARPPCRCAFSARLFCDAAGAIRCSPNGPWPNCWRKVALRDAVVVADVRARGEPRSWEVLAVDAVDEAVDVLRGDLGEDVADREAAISEQRKPARVLEIRARRTAERVDHEAVAVVLVLRLANVAVDVADRHEMFALDENCVLRFVRRFTRLTRVRIDLVVADRRAALRHRGG